MSVVMDIFYSLKERLKQLEYPNINTLNDEQISHIFSNENRIRLLVWYVEKLHPNFVLPTSAKDLKTHVANVIHENGFCKSSEKNKFVEGPMDIPSQLKIIKKMLNYLSLIQSHKENLAPVNYEKTDINELDTFLKQDINLFPAYGPMKVRTSTERKQKIEGFEREILVLKQRIETLQQEGNANLELHANEIEIDANVIKGLQDNIQQFVEDSNGLLKYKVGCKKEGNGFKDGFGDITSNCRAQLCSVSESVECMKVISNFSTNPSVRNTEENELVDVVKHLSQLSDEVISKCNENEV